MRSANRGFSLIELAIVVLILALLTGGLLMPVSETRNLERREQTGKSLEQIRESLLGFALQYGRLPCPASPAIASGNPLAGEEQRTGGGCACADSGGSLACTPRTASGVLPWVSLGLPETDGWGRRFSYQVSRTFARDLADKALLNYDCEQPPPPAAAPAQAPAQSAFDLCSRGRINVYQSRVPDVRLTGKDEVPALFMSHGGNGVGAWLPDASRQPGALGAELENSNDDENFIVTVNIDDQAGWISRPILMSRMIAAGKLP